MTTSTQKDVFSTLLAGSRSVHQRIGDGAALGIDQQEETITEDLLLNVARAHPDIQVATFTKHEESHRTGADWEWWWEGETAWFGAIVQAKKLARRGSNVGTYGFGYRPRRPGADRQIDTLLTASRRRRLPPAYVLYHGPEIDSHLHRWICEEVPPDPSALGAALVPAAIVADLLGMGIDDFDGVASHLRPLSCMVCPHRCEAMDPALDFIFNREDPLPPQLLGFEASTDVNDQAYLAARSYVSTLASRWVGQLRAADRTGRAPAPLRVVQQGVREAPPLYVMAAMRRGQDEPLDVRLDLDAPTPPRRVVVLRRRRGED